ncbi:MAG: DNA polymerase IV [Gammaproteobacteria bacterium]|nr:DNA polymerase IV [Gammaproteobacteria bacterium]MBV8405771.1 DNA polymerase IV [Gammaproteobacteria bacterium]
MSRAVLHVDMDAFYASVEQHDDPALAGRPVIVGWEGARGVVAAASYEVRRFGVHSAMPMRTALRLCPQAVCVRPRMQRYQEVSRVVFGVFREMTPLVEGLSLDEAFLDVTASAHLPGGAVGIARAIKERIAALTGLTASVGVAPNKLVAKIASDLMKPDGLTVVEPERVHALLDPLSVRRLPGLGRKTGARVEEAGIHTLGELRSAPDAVLWPLFGRYTAWMRERASGVDERPVLAEVEEKSLSAEETFEHDIGDPRSLQRELAGLAELAASRLRQRGLQTACIGVKIRRADFVTFTRQRAVAPPTCEARAVGDVSRELLTRWLAVNGGAKLRLLGVVLTELTPASQLGLFEDSRRAGRLDAAFDEARQRFGSRALRRGNTIE